MKKIPALLILAAVAAMPLAASAADAGAYADVLSAYVFRGQVGNDEAVFQPGLDVEGPMGFAFNFWSSMNLTDNESVWYPDSAGEFGELNLGLSWALPWEGPVAVKVGGLYFVYPQDASEVETDENGAIVLGDDGNAVVSEAPADGGYEVFAEVSATEVILSPTVRLCHDLDNADDWIALLSVSHEIGLTDVLSLGLGANVGYAGEYYVADNYGSDVGEAFSHVQFDASLSYAVSQALSVGLKGSYSSLLDGDVRDDVEATDFYPETDIFYGGVTASYSF